MMNKVILIPINTIQIFNWTILMLIQVNQMANNFIQMRIFFIQMPVRVIQMDNLATILGFLILKTGKRGQNVNTRIKMIYCLAWRKF